METKDSVICITCAKASKEKKLQWSSNADSAFITKGFSNWKDATVKFSIHDSSKCHKEAVLKIQTLPSTTSNIAECLSQQIKKEKLDKRQCFLKILSNMKFLARQGMINSTHREQIQYFMHKMMFFGSLLLSLMFQLLTVKSSSDIINCEWFSIKSELYISMIFLIN